MTFENLLVNRDARVAVLTLNRPSVLNALNAALLEELHRAALDCRDDAAIGVVIITGTGKAFAAGADIRELTSMGPAEARCHALRGQQVCDTIEQMGKPVIAAINGLALGGGCELSMACTLRIAAQTAVMGQPEVMLGVTPGFGGTQRLPRLVGKGVALDLLLTGRQVTAAEALAIGLVNRVVADGDVLTVARELAAELAVRAPIATSYILDLVNRGFEMSLDQAQALEASAFGLAFSTADMREGTSAFLERRKPRFTGR